MAKILLAWEAGAFLGHETLVTAAAVLLRAAGHDVVVRAPEGIAINDPARRAELRWANMPTFADEGAPSTGVPWESRATTLWNFGFHSPDLIDARFRAWDAALHHDQPDVAVLQASPYAQLAARVAGVPSVEFGIGFDVPPQQAPFPPFRHVESFDPATALRFEQSILDRLRRTVGPAANGPLHALVSGDRRLAVSVPELDHYDGVQDPSREFLGPLPVVEWSETRPGWKRGRPRVLAYVRAALLDAPALVRAIGSLRGDAVVVCLGADAATVALARKLGVRLHLTPVSFGNLLPGADVVVSHGGGLMSEAVILGRPCLAIPSHYEQFMTASTLKRRGLGAMLNPREPAMYERALRHVLAHPEMRHNAAAVALRHRGAADTVAPAFVAAIEATIEENR